MAAEREEPGGSFVAAVSLVFGILAWAQMPAVCGFMLSSTLAGADNYVYSIWLGAMIAVIGLASSLRAVLRRRRGRMLLIGALLSVGFIAFSALAHRAYDDACHVVYAWFPLPPS